MKNTWKSPKRALLAFLSSRRSHLVLPVNITTITKNRSYESSHSCPMASNRAQSQWASTAACREVRERIQCHIGTRTCSISACTSSRTRVGVQSQAQGTTTREEVCSRITMAETALPCLFSRSIRRQKSLLTSATSSTYWRSNNTTRWALSRSQLWRTKAITTCPSLSQSGLQRMSHIGRRQSSTKTPQTKVHQAIIKTSRLLKIWALSNTNSRRIWVR